jgi:hypothetical protein
LTALILLLAFLIIHWSNHQLRDTIAMSTTLKRLTALAFATLGFAATGQAHAMAQVKAGDPAIEMGAPGDLYDGVRTLGFSFSVGTDAFATALGIYDDGGNGLNKEAQVAIWNAAGDVLTSATIPSGTISDLDPNGYFRYASIPNYRLVAGVTYVIGAYSTDYSASSLWADQGGSGGVHSGFVVVNAAASSTKDFSFPNRPGVGGGAWLGANLRIAPIPEPETYQMLALGLLVVTAGATLRRRRQDASN